MAIDAKIPMIATTIMSSTRVKPAVFFILEVSFIIRTSILEGVFCGPRFVAILYQRESSLTFYYRNVPFLFKTNLINLFICIGPRDTIHIMRTQVIQGAGVIVLFALGIMLNFELMPVRRSQFRPGGDEVPFTWHPNLFRMISFGHVPAATDWLLIKFLTTPEWKHVAPGKRAKSYYDLELATDLDPAFFSLYTAGSQFLTVIRNDNDGALKIIEKGEAFRRDKLPSYPKSFRDEQWANAWRVPFLKAFIEMFELGDFPAASQTLSVMHEFPNAPDYLKRIATHLLDPVERYDVGERMLGQMIGAAKTDVERDQLRLKLENLKLARELAVLNQAFDGFLHRKYGAKFAMRNLPNAVAQREFAEYLTKSKRSPLDQRGGRLRVHPSGRIDTTTKRERVFGLD